MKELREWFKDGVGKFSSYEFLIGNLKKNMELKMAILEVIERRKEELTKLIVDGDECTWSTQEIFAKVLMHHNYLKKSRLEAKVEKSCGGDSSERKPSEHDVYVPTVEEENHMGFQVNIQTMIEDVSHSIPITRTLIATSLCVTTFGSPFHIPEQVIQIRKERLEARKSIVQYQFFQELDEGMIGFGGSSLIQRLLDGPYERWEVEVTDLASGIGMKTLFLPGTNRAASTIKIGERLILPAIYLLMGERVPDSEINRVEVLEESSNSEDRRLDF